MAAAKNMEASWHRPLTDNSGFLLLKREPPTFRRALSCGSPPQRGGSVPARRETSNFPPHDFELLDLLGASLAPRQMSLERQRIGEVQLSVKKSMKCEFPFYTGAGHLAAALERRRPGHRHVQEIIERERHLALLSAPDFVESRSFHQLHLSPPRRGNRRKAPKIGHARTLITRDSRSRDKIPKDCEVFGQRKKHR
jgi:hypothetical protein